MKRLKINLLLISILLTAMLVAQGNERPSMGEMHGRKWDFIVEKAQLSAQEAERIKPFFLEYEKAVWGLMEKNKDFFRDFYRNKENRSEAQYAEMNERYVNLEIQKSVLLKNYYAKLKKQLSAESIFRYFNAERSFRKDLIDKWQDRPRGPRR